MIKMLNKIRAPSAKLPFSKALPNTLLIMLFGVLIGIAAKLFDIYTTNLGNVFSQMSVWIFICAVIAAFSCSPFRAAVNVFLFCIGMLAAYYVTAELLSSVYSMQFVYGWVLFSLLSPVLGFCTWYARGSGVIPKIITAGIIIVMLVAAAVLFDKIRISDIIIAVITGIVLLKK